MNGKEQQKSLQEANSSGPQERQGWGMENLPYPTGAAYISTRWDESYPESGFTAIFCLFPSQCKPFAPSVRKKNGSVKRPARWTHR